MWQGLTEHRQKHATEDLCQRDHGHQVVLAGRHPHSVLADTAARHQQVDVGMIGQRRRPGVQDGQDPESSAHIAWIGRQLHQRLGGGLHQDAVQHLLMSAHQRA